MLVTGVSRGIGRALVPVLLEAGARVAGCARSQEGLDRLAASLSYPADALMLACCDVGDPGAVAAWVESVEAAWGGVDVLVNNAAILPKPAAVEELDPAIWTETMQVNVVGTAAACKAVLPGMRVRGHGVIVNVSSTWGRSAAGRVAPYCASKFAVEGLTQSLAQEVPAGVAVVSLNPGVIATDMLADAFEGDVSAYPSPESLGPRWLALFGGIGPSWNGRALDL